MPSVRCALSTTAAKAPKIERTKEPDHWNAEQVRTFLRSVGGDRLEVGSGNTDRVAVGGGVGDGPQELEELRGANDGVGLTGRFDELLLRDLGPHVSTVGKPVGTDDGECDVMFDACLHLGLEQVTSGGLEELENRRVLEGRRVGQVDDHLGVDHC